MQVFNFGSINIDHVYRIPHLVKPGETLSSKSMSTVLGGKGANQSVALARAGVRVCHIGRLAHADAWAVDLLRDAGIDVSNVQLVDGPSGHAIIQVDDVGENSIILHGGANTSFEAADFEQLLNSANSGDWLLIQNECNGLENIFAEAQKRQLRIAFNPAPMTELVARLPLNYCNVLIVNETEAAALAQSEDVHSALDILANKYPDTQVVLTLGAEGAMLACRDQKLHQESLPVDVVDTTGAGDTFVGYFLAALLADLDQVTALRRACAAAALSVTVPGATPSIPAARSVDEFLAHA
ncbi:MAG: ribokinase [Granulosicoccus sp.]|nr:ribokinase [Granulosicoccus sp.]